MKTFDLTKSIAYTQLTTNYIRKIQFLSSPVAVVIVLGLVEFVGSAKAANQVRGYYKSSTGRYIMPYYRTSLNRSKFDNYSTMGNYNPYTGKEGTVSPFRFNYQE